MHRRRRLSTSLASMKRVSRDGNERTAVALGLYTAASLGASSLNKPSPFQNPGSLGSRMYMVCSASFQVLPQTLAQLYANITSRCGRSYRLIRKSKGGISCLLSCRAACTAVHERALPCVQDLQLRLPVVPIFPGSTWRRHLFPQRHAFFTTAISLILGRSLDNTEQDVRQRSKV